MSPEVGRLEALLARVQRNRSVSRTAPASLDTDEPGTFGASVPPDSLDEPPESGTERLEATLSPPARRDDAPITPPPESGEERAFDPPRRDGPTMEQLGQTIALDEGNVRILDLDEPLASDRPAPSSERLEMSLPSAMLGSYESGLVAPPEARADLERVLRSDAGDLAVQSVARPPLATTVVDLINAQRSFRPSSFVELVDASLAL